MISTQTTSPLQELRSNHEEADTRTLLHANHASSNKKRIILQSPDTDVAVIAIHKAKELQCQEFWFKTGTKDRVRFIPIDLVADKLGNSICEALPGFHALTGRESTSGFFRMGKKKAWKLFSKDDDAQDCIPAELTFRGYPRSTNQNREFLLYFD